MTETVLVAVAWPYANAEIHVGNLTGSYLPADIFARYQRLRGRRVIMVSGSDAHGTPITIRADAEGSTALEVYQRFHAGFLDLYQQAGISYDLFTSTHTANHFRIAQAVFTALDQNGYLYRGSDQQWYDTARQRFLPDRYVEGTCYICGYENARSDQCDRCGSVLDPARLINPRAKIGGGALELRETEHYYLDLSKLQPEILEFLRSREDYWRPNVVNRSIGYINNEGLRGRPITRDLDWGIPVPVEGLDGKRLYVWFEAVIGYLSAAIELSALTGGELRWQDWWQNPDAKAYYFIGKDNIDFHAILWPGQLIGCGTAFARLVNSGVDAPLTLPYDVPANEFLNLEGEKISGSRSWAVWGRDFLSRYDPDPLRYYLTVTMPETRDADWDWDDFFHKNNDELVATWGNLANRVLSFAYKHWDGHVPEPGALGPEDEALLASVESGFANVAEQIEAVHLRAALAEAVRLASEVNKYLDQTAPWFQIKTDKSAAARSIYTALRAIDSLKVLLAPFLPFSAERLHATLGYDRPLFGEQYTETVTDALGEHTALRYNPEPASGRWEPSRLRPGQSLRQPQPLFKKLDISIVEEERARLGKPE